METSRQVCLLCPWARHLTGRLHLYVVDRWPTRTSPDYNCEVANPACRKRRLLGPPCWWWGYQSPELPFMPHLHPEKEEGEPQTNKQKSYLLHHWMTVGVSQTPIDFLWIIIILCGRLTDFFTKHVEFPYLAVSIASILLFDHSLPNMA